MRRRFLFTIILSLAGVVVLSHAGEKRAPRQEVSIDLHVGAEWSPVFPSTAVPDGDATTLSAFRILRAVDPETNKRFDTSNDVFGCNPADLHRTFRIQKTEFLLAEPILVDFSIRLDGPGEWNEPVGGNYRARGRDDNFLFVMKHEDGTWVRDPYAPVTMYMGGIASTYQVKANEPRAYWFAVQRWCAIDRPGTYELYCLQMNHGHEVAGSRAALVAAMPDEIAKGHFLNDECILIDRETNERSERYSIVPTWRRHQWQASPLLKKMPAELAEYVQKTWPVQDAADFAHFKIIVREGSARQRERMIRYWTKIAESTEDKPWPKGQTAAAREAICFARQDDFLPVIEKWIPTFTQPSDYYGLAMRPSPKATEILLKEANPNAVAAMYYLHPDRIGDAIPQLINRLTHEDDRMRAESEYRLHLWAGQAFCRDWQGYDHERPTLDEGRRMQPMWQEWWQRNKDDFVPKTR
jgi:hypothetical protein